jgi:uracil-DNA glycosylase
VGRIALVGEAWGEQEELLRMPFVGAAGHELNRMLAESGIERSGCLVTNVFALRPKPTNDIENLCAPASAVSHTLPAIKPGKYIRDEYLPELDRLYAELKEFQPWVTVALGGTALWALCGDGRISKLRGTAMATAHGKVLPTYHPAAVLRQYDLRPVTVLDLAKARRESEFPEVRRPDRTIIIEPSLSDIEEFYNDHIVGCRILAFDIETSGDQITCIGFAPRTDLALVVPFVDPRKGGNYWPSKATELLAWGWVRTILATDARKVGQNTLYDIRFLWQRYGIPVMNYTDDTMLLHHALFPESEKSLGFLGSVYTNEPSWKMMRGKQTIKKED